MNILAKIKLLLCSFKSKNEGATTISKTVTDEEIVYIIVIKRKPK